MGTPVSIAHELRTCQHTDTCDESELLGRETCNLCGAERERPPNGAAPSPWVRPDLVEALVDAVTGLRLDASTQDLATELASRARELGDAGDGFLRSAQALAAGCAMIATKKRRVLVVLDSDEWESIRGTQAALEVMIRLREETARVVGVISFDVERSRRPELTTPRMVKR